MKRISFATAVAAITIFIAPAMSQESQSAHQEQPAIVIGFLGGYVKHDNPVHAEVQLADRLRKTYSTAVDVETFESRHVSEAREKILDDLSGKQHGVPTTEEKRSARIVLYGHSWGAASTIELARQLEKDGIPVLLTVQVDSIAKFHENDTTIPANVTQAANFYQPHGILHGDHDIRAADPEHTKILGNFRYDYTDSPLKCSRYPWWDRYVVRAHTQIECDPVVWNKVDALIRQALPPTTQSARQ
jgi:hypothetical protein